MRGLLVRSMARCDIKYPDAQLAGIAPTHYSEAAS